MTASPLNRVQSVVVGLACAMRTGRDLRILRESVERASALPSGESWKDKAAAHTEFHCLLWEATSTSAYSISMLALAVSRTIEDMMVAAGPSAENFIIVSHRRVLVYLWASDGDRAAREMEGYLAKLDQMSGLFALAGIPERTVRPVEVPPASPRSAQVNPPTQPTGRFAGPGCLGPV